MKRQIAVTVSSDNNNNNNNSNNSKISGNHNSIANSKISTGKTPSVHVSPHSGPQKRTLLEPLVEEKPGTKKLKKGSTMAGKRNIAAFTAESEHERKCSAATSDMEGHDGSSSSNVIVGKENWQGFCEIESDPAYFSVILREMGVKDVAVREVFAMDSAILDMVPQPIYGLILLFRYRDFGTHCQATEGTNDVWFCNQLPTQNSCGTLAMINIIMNSPEIDIGEHMTQFKEFTHDMSSVQRGETLASFDFVKKIHNSFAKRMDILENDKHLAAKANRFERHKEQTETKAKKSNGRRASKESVVSEDSTDSFEESGHHFIAFVPVGNQVWKLDGMDVQPSSVGTFDAASGESWLSAVSNTINTLMAAGDSDYGVLAISQSPISSLRNQAALTLNTLGAVESRLEEMDQTLGDCEAPPSAAALGIGQQELLIHPVPPTVVAQIANEEAATLLTRRRALVEELGGAAASITVEMDEIAAEELKARQRRFDAGPVLKLWLEMLAENGYFEENLHRFMPR
ncbi:hypothetical protein ACEQ8H_000955 [Pleosporales sp. CAS-2024a]